MTKEMVLQVEPSHGRVSPMPRSVDHIVATHSLARSRVQSGLPSWAEKVDLADVFHDEALPFEVKRDAIVARLKATNWYRNADPDEWDGVREVVDEHLADANEVDDFDFWWDILYDLADYARVWINVF